LWRLPININGWHLAAGNWQIVLNNKSVANQYLSIKVFILFLTLTAS